MARETTAAAITIVETIVEEIPCPAAVASASRGLAPTREPATNLVVDRMVVLRESALGLCRVKATAVVATMVAATTAAACWEVETEVVASVAAA